MVGKNAKKTQSRADNDGRKSVRANRKTIPVCGESATNVCVYARRRLFFALAQVDEERGKRL